jgi:hypothetical protein
MPGPRNQPVTAKTQRAKNKADNSIAGLTAQIAAVTEKKKRGRPPKKANADKVDDPDDSDSEKPVKPAKRVKQTQADEPKIPDVP